MDVGVTIGESFDRVDRIGDGFEFVELGIGEDAAPTDTEPGAVIERLAAVECGLCVHLPFSQVLVTPVRELNEAIVEYLARLLKWCGAVQAEKAVIHATARDPHRRDLRPLFAEQLRAVAERAEAYGIELVVENVGHQRRGLPLSVVVDLAEEADVPMCFDVGHAYMEDGQDAIDRIVRRHAGSISHLHVHDARSRGDTHLPLGAGEIDWTPLTDHLQGFAGTVAIEVFTDDRILLDDTKRRIDEILRPDVD